MGSQVKVSPNPRMEQSETTPTPTPTRNRTTSTRATPPGTGSPNDYPQNGRLLGWHSAWPKGWAHEVCKSGLRWPWKDSRPPRLRYQVKLPRTSPSVASKVEDLLAKGVVEEGLYSVQVS